MGKEETEKNEYIKEFIKDFSDFISKKRDKCVKENDSSTKEGEECG